MSNIIQFKPKVNKSRDRVEAMVKGQLRTFTCDSCGEVFEAYFNNLPSACPNCKLRIRWEDSNYDRTR